MLLLWRGEASGTLPLEETASSAVEACSCLDTQFSWRWSTSACLLSEQYLPTSTNCFMTEMSVDSFMISEKTVGQKA